VEDLLEQMSVAQSRVVVRNKQSEHMMRDPKQTIAYLDELEELGFTNEAFWRLHHFRDKGRHDTIQSHRRYCEKTESFHEDETNERVQIRLEIVLKHFKQYYADPVRADGTSAAKIFPLLADAAYTLVPTTA
jgi:hypothetical protein